MRRSRAPRWAIDANALIAFRNREPGAERVRQVMWNEGAVISTVNFSEVALRVVESGGEPAAVEDQLRDELVTEARLEIVAFDQVEAIEHARLEHLVLPAFRGQKKRPTYEDLALLAVASVRDLRVLTSDSQVTPAWIDVGLHVEHFRPWKLVPAPAGFPKKLR